MHADRLSLLQLGPNERHQWLGVDGIRRFEQLSALALGLPLDVQPEQDMVVFPVKDVSTA